MIGAERIILIGCLLQGTLGRKWEIWMPQSIEALSGSCVLIPCRFEIPSEYDAELAQCTQTVKGKWLKDKTLLFDSSKQSGPPLQGKIAENLAQKNCTTVLENLPLSYSGQYHFRLECDTILKATFPPPVEINITDSPPKPKLTPEKVEVMEGTSVSLSCSVAAPCPKLPPNLTWTPRLSDSVDQLHENEDKTTSVSSVLTFTASHLHHRQKITCRALYTLQQGGNQTSEASLTLKVLYMPQISGSGSCSRTAAEISCSCESRGNPSPSMEWHVSGLRVTNSTDRVIREEQLGNTGLRSSLTMRHSQGDTAALLCLSTNALGTSSLQLHVPSPHSGVSVPSLLIGAAAGVAAMVIVCLIVKAIQKLARKKRDSQCCESGWKDTEESSPQSEEEPVYSNHSMATTQPRDPQLGGTDPQPLAEDRNKAELETMHYASIKHSPRSVETQGQDAREGAAGHGDDVVYSQVARKKKTKKGKQQDGEGLGEGQGEREGQWEG
ncbi:myelin-associated glycoprotein-like [Conger conger]|uniref:myelin-associated glycoprotein-like n=1 Tax=Conger conger TaxID=82655 RepID=UPI002A5A952D|nr:myelin-associated glycoprotein-like [Conger conger]